MTPRHDQHQPATPRRQHRATSGPSDGRRRRGEPSKPIARLDALDAKRRAEAALVELKLAERRGEVAEVAEFEAAQVAIADAVREQVLGVAGTAVSLGIVAPADEAKLDDLLRSALRALSGAAE